MRRDPRGGTLGHEAVVVRRSTQLCVTGRWSGKEQLRATTPRRALWFEAYRSIGGGDLCGMLRASMLPGRFSRIALSLGSSGLLASAMLDNSGLDLIKCSSCLSPFPESLGCSFSKLTVSRHASLVGGSLQFITLLRTVVAPSRAAYGETLNPKP